MRSKATSGYLSLSILPIDPRQYNKARKMQLLGLEKKQPSLLADGMN